MIEDFVVQGGGFLPDLSKQEPVRDAIVNEFDPAHSNVQYTVSMAKLGGDPDSATSQFFFNLADNSENLDNQNGGFTVFAEIIEGQDVVDAMGQVETSTQQDPEGNCGDRKLTQVDRTQIDVEKVSILHAQEEPEYQGDK